ncbi:MAG: hypothetical protein WA771_01325 [Chthoniobacterales bacterium]
MKKTIILAITIAGLGIGTAFTQETKVDVEAQKRITAVLEARLNARKAQTWVIGKDILELHQRMDKSLAQMVDRIAALKDSVRSSQQIGNLKIEMIEGLQEAIETFRSKRMALSRELQSGDSAISPKVIKDEITHLDQHMDAHLDQMLKLSKSFAQNNDVKKYESVSKDGGGAGGHGDTPIQINPEWELNLRNRYLNEKQREIVEAALEKSIDRCDTRIRAMRADLEQKALTDVDREMIQSELDVHVSMLEQREQQMKDLLVVAEPNTTEVTRNEAQALESAVDELMNDVQRDVRAIASKHAQLNAEQQRIAQLESTLEARKKWLADYE